MTVTERDVRALSRHLLNERLIHRAFNDYWRTHLDPSREGRGDPAEPEFFAWVSMWYSSLYVVWDGCIAIGVEVDLPFDDLDVRREELRRFRNKTFHVEPPFPHAHLLAYIGREDSVTFAHALGIALGYAVHREAERLGMERSTHGVYL